MERDDRLSRLMAHGADCTECRAAPLPLDHLAAVLEEAAPDLDAAALSRHTFARLRPELQRRAMQTGSRHIAIAMLLSLLPLPLVVAYDAYFLRLAYDFLSAVIPATFAAYMVLSYAAFLLLLFASTYAAIPLLVVQPRTYMRSA
jgi:hypothetical protein